MLRLSNNRIASLSDAALLPPAQALSEGLTALGATLQVLQLANNRITSIAGLQLLRMPELRVLYLQGNDIQQIDGLDGCPQLRELVLDRNKIKKLDPRAFVNIQVCRLEGLAGCLFACVFEDILYYLGL